MSPQLLVAELPKWAWPNSDVRIYVVEDRHELALWHQRLLKACVKEWVGCCNLLFYNRLRFLTKEVKLQLNASSRAQKHTPPHPKQGTSVKPYLGLIMFGANIKPVLNWQPFLVPSHRRKFIDAKHLVSKLCQAKERTTCRQALRPCSRRAAVMWSALRSCKYLHDKPWSS